MSEIPAGRRGNGLQASDWGALVDLDPRLAEGLLDRLAAAGVAAYVEPASATDPFSRATLPSRPLDRLWVDPDRAEAARGVVAAEVADLSALLAETEPGATAHGLVQAVPSHAARRVLAPPVLPDPPPRAATAAPAGPPAPRPESAPAPDPQPRLSDDEVFRQIVAGFAETAPDPVPRWPAREDPGGPVPDLGRDLDLDLLRRRPPPVDRGPRRRRGDAALPPWVEPPRLEPDADDLAAAAADPLQDDHYVPPPPPPVPRVSLRTVGAVAVLVLGVLLLFVPQVLRQSETPGSLLLGVVLLVGGSAALVLRVRDAPDDDAGPDGAVV